MWQNNNTEIIPFTSS